MRNLPKNVYIISIASGLCYSATALMMLTGILVGYELTHNDYWSTLPIASLFLSIAFFTPLVSKLIDLLGFKTAYALSIILAIIASGLAAYAAHYDNFALFIFSSVLLGFNGRFIRQARFTIISNLTSKEQSNTSLSFIASCCLVGTFFGPAIGTYGQNLISLSHNYSGSFLILCGIFLIALLILLTGYNNNDENINKKLNIRYLQKLIYKKIEKSAY